MGAGWFLAPAMQWVWLNSEAGRHSVRTETQARGSPAHPHLSPVTAGMPPLTQTTTPPEPMIQGGGIAPDWSEGTLRRGGASGLSQGSQGLPDSSRSQSLTPVLPALPCY